MIPKENNFDLIRLLAALQVAINHTTGDLGITRPSWSPLALTDLFPGVPVFFLISGFLISRSFERNPVVREYALNRVLRIYPALWVCFAVSLLSVWLTGYFDTHHVRTAGLLGWAAAQLSIAQFYNPEFMRQYGLGVLNGSMWTISVELQFYLLVPLLYTALRLHRTSTRASNRALLLVAVVFLLLNQVYAHAAAGHARDFWYRFAGVTFAPWFYMFVAGILLQRNFARVQTVVGGRLPLLLSAYCVVALAASRLLGWNLGNTLNPVLFAALSVVIFSAAFSNGTLSDMLLRRNDLSYGVYIYHAPAINCALVLGLGSSTNTVLVVMAATLALACASWLFVEKPALALKRHPLYQHERAGALS
jgi:peptidoglycan/LPS O-acetylase OafA/YrhL